MAIDFSSMLLKLNPMSAIDLSGAGGNAAQMGMERQRLALERQKFEEIKKNNARDAQLREMELNGRTTAQRMETEREREKAKALMEAKRREQAQAAYGAAYKAVNDNDQAGVSIAANQLREYGGLAEELPPDEQGRPNWRLGTDAAGYGQRRQQADAVTRDIATNAPEGSVWVPPSVTQSATLDRLGALGLGGLDREGVVSMGQNADTRAAQAQPSLDAYRDAFPEGPRRDSQASVNRAAALRGLNPTDTLGAANTLGAQPGAATQAAIDAEAKLKEEEVKLDKPMNPKEEQELINYGYERTDKSFKTQKTGDRITSLEMADELTRLVQSDNPSDHGKAVNLMMVLGKQSGPQSDADAQRIAGNEDLSTVDQAKAWVQKLVVGGKWKAVRDSMVEFAKRAREREREVVFSWIGSQQEAANGARNPLTGEGITQFLSELPESVLKEYEAAYPDEEEEGAEPAPQGAQGMQGQPIRFDMTADATKPVRPSPLRDDDFEGELVRQAEEAGLNPEAIRGVISFESGANGAAENPLSGASGILQFLPSVAKAMGTTVEAIRKMTPTEQIPLVLDYFKTRGLTAEHDQGDYYIGTSAPAALGKPDGTVVYKKGSKAWEQNPLWRPADGGDITVGSLKAAGGGKRKAKGGESVNEKPAEAKAPGKDDAFGRDLLKD